MKTNKSHLSMQPQLNKMCSQQTLKSERNHQSNAVCSNTWTGYRKARVLTQEGFFRRVTSFNLHPA